MAKTILIVEDDFDTRHPLAELLRLKGYEVTNVANVDLALKAARERLPDLIITDIILPGQTGLHLIHHLRAAEPTRAVPIIVISGCEAPIMQRAAAAGANFCLQKPIQLPLFMSTIAQILKDENGQPWLEGERKTEGVYAGTIDRLIDELQQSGSNVEKEGVIKRLKDQLLNAGNSG